MAELEKPRSVVRFEGFELDLRSGELRPNGGGCIGLSDQPFRILTTLLQHPGNVVLREEIRKTLWPNDTVVEFEHSINSAMKRLRQALGDSPENPRYIETLARRGYRWMVAVEWVDATPARPGSPSVAAPEAAPSAANLIGKKVSHYRVLEILGGGGMGVIYKAEDLKLGRRVALKFLPEEVASEPSALARFEREARAASALDHPNICAIHEFGEHDGHPFIVMQLLEGQTLRERIGAAPPHPGKALPTEELLDFAIQITRGLEAAHEKGIIHRDIKPANIFLTRRGEAKILDFGVAKLVHGDRELDASAHPASPDDAPPFDPSSPLNLTRTGTTVGTASYMSPEQILGEKLDPRTDLFSFGLVLYEMATGQQAFAGDTAVVIREAILHRPVQPARQSNPSLSSAIEKVIAKALQKDRSLRYQHASEICAELLRQTRPAGTRRRRWAVVVAAAFTLTILAAAVYRASKSDPPAIAFRKEVQLTSNPSENHIENAAISPDGKYLEYTDAKGMHIRFIATGEIKNIPEPEAFKDVQVHWDLAGWFPDSARFIANAHPPAPSEWSGASRNTSIWIFSLLGGPPQKLRDHAVAYSVSPDGSLISFGTNQGRFGDREIWQMGPSGDQAVKLYETDEESAIGGLYWSRDGNLVVYDKTDTSGDTIISARRDPGGGPPTTILSSSETAGMSEYWFLPDGRVVYDLPAPLGPGDTANYWTLRIDLHTGRRAGKPTQITNWPGFCVGSVSATADGKKIAVNKWAPRKAILIADLKANGRQIAQPSGVASSTAFDFLGDWTADGNAVVFMSDRNGHYGLFKQSVGEESVQTLVYGPENAVFAPVVSPDGDWVLYSSRRRESPGESVMRVPITGGASEFVLKAGRGGSQNWGMIRCAKSLSNLCAIAQRDGDRPAAILSALDPLKGLGPELLRFDLDVPELAWLWDLSPDGTRIAFCKSRDGSIYIFSLKSRTTQEVKVKGWDSLQSLDWAADGKGFFVSNSLQRGYALLHVDLNGDAQVLLQQPGGVEGFARPSRDGRHLAIEAGTMDGNIWMIENF